MTTAQKILLKTLLGGFASAALGLCALVFPFPGAVVLSYFSLLPLFLVGLGLGLRPLYGASVLVIALSFLVDTPLSVLQTMLAILLGPIFLVNRALLYRTKSSGEFYWYPSAELLKMFTLSLGAFLILAFGVYFYTTQGEDPQTYILKLLEVLDPQKQIGKDAEYVLATAFPLLPGLFSISWGLMVLINGAMAQGILVRLKKNLRPSPSLETLDVPKSFSLLFAACLLLSFISIGYTDVLAKNLACVLAFPFFLVGLGVGHRLIQKTSHTTIALTLFYLLLLFFWPILIVMGVGLLKPWIEKFI